MIVILERARSQFWNVPNTQKRIKWTFCPLDPNVMRKFGRLPTWQLTRYAAKCHFDTLALYFEDALKSAKLALFIQTGMAAQVRLADVESVDFKRKSMSIRITSIGLRRRNPHPHRCRVWTKKGHAP